MKKLSFILLILIFALTSIALVPKTGLLHLDGLDNFASVKLFI